MASSEGGHAEFFEEVTGCVNEGSPVDVVYMDFSKAFDIWETDKEGKCRWDMCKMIKWIQNWLSCRRQRVMTEGALVTGSQCPMAYHRDLCRASYYSSFI